VETPKSVIAINRKIANTRPRVFVDAREPLATFAPIVRHSGRRHHHPRAAPPGRMGMAEIVDVVNEAGFTRKSLTAFE
jgi:hypothetical protein